MNSVLSVFLQKVRLLLIPSFLFFLSMQCSRQVQVYDYVGTTMGTTYSIKVLKDPQAGKPGKNFQLKIDSLLVEVNSMMSTYIPDSELSILNTSHQSVPVEISKPLSYVLSKSKNMYKQTNGAFDITVHPLVKLWGFGNAGSVWSPPDAAVIQGMLNSIGSDKFELNGDYLVKLNPEVDIDLSAIAKGYGVDVVAELITQLGFNNYMVEVGGEVRCSGKNAAGESWKIGIQYPDASTARGMKLIGTVDLDEMSMATSGNYRNYFDFDGKRYSHTIDPVTGYPVINSLVSATVIAPKCIDADAVATALMVLGPDKGLKLVEAEDSIECFMVLEDRGGNLTRIFSSGFDDYFSGEGFSD